MRVRVEAVPTTGRPLRIAVVDTGIGIRADRIAAIFDAFSQADNSTARQYGGTGLGLTISCSLALLPGFDVEATSEVGVGSTFTIALTSLSTARTHVPPTLHRGMPGGPRVKGAALRLAQPRDEFADP